MKFNLIKNKKYNLHIIEEDRFRTCGLEINFRCEFDPKKAIAFTLLTDILTDQSKKYPTSKFISRHMEESYILNFYGSFNRTGKIMNAYIFCDYIDPKYIDEKDYLDNTYKFIFDVISNPLIVNNGFDENNFNIVKNRLIKELNSMKESNVFLSINHALKIFSKNESINYHMIDYLDFLKNLTPQDLYEFYQDLVKNTSVDIFVSGSTDKEEIAKVINKYYPFDNKEYVKYDELTYAKNKLFPTIKKEKSSFKQSTLIMIFNVNCLNMFEREFVMPYYLNILNSGGLTSKLYQSLREKNSLCYNVNTSYYDRCNYLLVSSTINVGKERKAIHLVKKSIKEMKNRISEKEFIGAYYAYQGSLKGMLDSLSAINRLYVNKYYAGFSSYEEKLENYKKVSVNDIYRLANKIRLNTIYVLRGDINERNQD